MENGKRRPATKGSAEGMKEEDTLWQFQRPLAGALIGVLIFLAILLPLKFLDYDSIFLYRLALYLELLGRLTVLIMGMSASIDLPGGAINLVSVAISSIPAWIAGWQIGSHNSSSRMKGIVFLAGYLLFIYAFGKLLAFAGV